MKKIVAVFNIPGMTAKQYDNVMQDLAAAGAKQQAARPYHFAAPSKNGWTVVDIWDSAEALNEFAGTLVPLLVKNGVTPSEPQVMELHNQL